MQALESSPAFVSIVAGTDFTPCSAVALGQAVRIASWSANPAMVLHVVHIIDTLVVDELEEALSPMQKGIRESLVRDAEAAWTGFAPSIATNGPLPEIRLEVVIDNRAVGLLKRAKAHKAELLVLGAYGTRAPDVGVGTVATACVRKSPSDVLLVRDTRPERGRGSFKRIVAAVDFSATSLRAVARAAMFAAKDKAELHLLHVFNAPWHELHYRAPTPEIAPHFQKQYRDGLARRLKELCRPFIEPQPDLNVQHVVYDTTSPRSGIVEYATKVNADLIVLGTRGRTNIRDILLGSTAEKALEESRCSVLAVKPEGFSHPVVVDAAAD